MLRDFFDLGPPIPVGAKPVGKMTKLQRVSEFEYFGNIAANHFIIFQGGGGWGQGEGVVDLLRSPAISLGFTILGEIFCVYDHFFFIQPLG